MSLFCAIDLHSNNSVVVVIDDQDNVVFKKRLPNDLCRVVSVLDPFRDELHGVAVESTFNWYWLVDGLQAAGFNLMLVNPQAAKQYQGLKHIDDVSDARWLANLMRPDHEPLWNWAAVEANHTSVFIWAWLGTDDFLGLRPGGERRARP